MVIYVIEKIVTFKISQQHFTYLTSEVNLDLRGLKIYEEK